MLTRTERIALLDREQADLTLTAQTDLLSLNRTSLYYRPVAPSAEEIALKRRIDEIFTDSALISRLFVLAPGELGLLHLSLISTADSFVDGSGDALYAFNLASVNVALSTSVPSPSPLFLIGAALLPVVRLRRARRV